MGEVLAEAAFRHFLFQIPVGRRDHPDINLVVAVTSDPLDLPILQRPQELGLHGQRQFSHLVEKQCALV
ncbi:MAG: hypothetical protein U5K56_18075 [Halioglobus sp.]|nr:hypothetical protein [Halioglobus sp.]